MNTNRNSIKGNAEASARALSIPGISLQRRSRIRNSVMLNRHLLTGNVNEFMSPITGAFVFLASDYTGCVFNHEALGKDNEADAGVL